MQKEGVRVTCVFCSVWFGDEPLTAVCYPGVREGRGKEGRVGELSVALLTRANNLW